MAMEHMSLPDAMGIIADHLDGLADAAQPIRNSSPMADSPAMAEIADEGRYRHVKSPTPVSHTHGYVPLTLNAVMEATMAYAHLLRYSELFMYPPFVIARSGLDAAAYGFWLVAPDIGTEARVQRGLAYRLHNTRKQMQVVGGGDPDLAAMATDIKERSRHTIATIKEIASASGWTISGRKQRQAAVGSEQMPETRTAIDALLSHYGPGPSTADLSWWLYSGVTHSTPYALAMSAAPAEARPTGVPGVVEVALYVSGPLLLHAAGLLGQGLLSLAMAYGRLFGLATEAMERSGNELFRTVNWMLEAMERSES